MSDEFLVQFIDCGWLDRDPDWPWLKEISIWACYPFLNSFVGGADGFEFSWVGMRRKLSQLGMIGCFSYLGGGIYGNAQEIVGASHLQEIEWGVGR